MGHNHLLLILIAVVVFAPFPSPSTPSSLRRHHFLLRSLPTVRLVDSTPGMELMFVASTIAPRTVVVVRSCEFLPAFVEGRVGSFPSLFLLVLTPLRLGGAIQPSPLPIYSSTDCRFLAISILLLMSLTVDAVALLLPPQKPTAAEIFKVTD